MDNLITVKENIPVSPGFNAILNIISNGVNSYTHGFHKYPAKYIPNIPRWAIHKYLSEDTGKGILDPFCGSGTTLVEGKLAGHNVYGFDIDPLSVLISKVKTTNLDEEVLLTIKTWLINNIHLRQCGKFTPECSNILHWFTEDAVQKLSIIRSVIDEIPEAFGDDEKVEDIRDFLLICFSSIIRRVSNADNQSQKTYVSHTKVKQPEEVYAVFFRQLGKFVEQAVHFSRQTDPILESKVKCASTIDFSLNNITEGKGIDLVVTSPPYIKAIDYIYNQMAELFWIGDLFDLQTQDKQNQWKKSYIGNKHLKKKDYIHYTPVTHQTGIDSLDQKLKEVYDTDPKNGHKHFYIAYQYFKSMAQHFQVIADQVSQNTHYIMVVGDCEISKVKFDNADFLAQIAENNGFKMIDKWGYKIKNRFMRFDRKGKGGIINIDWVLDFKKC